MKFAELNKKTESELKELLINDRDKLREARFNLASGKVKNVREIRSFRKDIARVLTIMRNTRKQTKE